MYGANTSLLRESLRELLTHHRIQQRIGGAGIHTLPEITTTAQRAELGEQIARYRHAVLVWCHLALRAANPHIGLDAPTGRTRVPTDELGRRLDAALRADPTPLPTMDELVTAQRFDLIDLWRRAARACALGEHDFDAAGHGRLPHAQSMTVVHDAAEITRALVALDRRYAKIPGWHRLQHPVRLGRAAEICAAYAGRQEPDYSVDRRGWKPPVRLIEGPLLPGLTGVLQAQQNLLHHLRTFPDAKSLRVIMDSQRVLSLEAAQRLVDTSPALATHWMRRADTYGRLIRQTRDIGGLLGNGGDAAGQGAIAAARIQKLPASGMADLQQARRLERIGQGIDERISAVVENGIAKRLYFQRGPAFEMNQASDGPTTLMRSTWLPVTDQLHTELLATVRNGLHPGLLLPDPARAAVANRLDFEAAITHRPASKRTPPDIPSI